MGTRNTENELKIITSSHKMIYHRFIIVITVNLIYIMRFSKEAVQALSMSSYKRPIKDANPKQPRQSQ